MGFLIKKEDLIRELDISFVYPFSSNLLMQLPLTNTDYSNYLTSGKYRLKLNIETNLDISSNMESFKKNISLNYKNAVKRTYDLIGNTTRYLEMRDLVDKKSGFKISSEEFFKKGFLNNLLAVSETVDFNITFSKSKKEMLAFLSQKEYFKYNEENGSVEVEISKPELKITKIKYEKKETKIYADFILDIFGKKYTSKDVYYYNDIFHIKNLFSKKEDLIKFNVKILEDKIKYLKDLNGTNEEGLLLKPTKLYIF